MKCREPIAFLCLLFSLVPQVEAESGFAAVQEARMPSEARKQAKRGIQVMVRSDGRLVDRLAELQPEKSSLPANSLNQRELPASPEAWLARMMDPTKNGLAAKSPEFFVEWLDAVTEPRFMTALASVAMTPSSYSSSLGKVTDPATARNWAEFADPQIYLRWMAAGLDPRFYQTIFGRMSNSGKLRRWGIYPGSNQKTAPDQESSHELAAESGSRGKSDEWLQLPMRESKANPWLQNNVNYRY